MPSIPTAASDLTQAPVATLATIGSDGRPQLSAVWFVYEDGVFRVSLNSERQKTKNLTANPAVNLFILDPSGMRYLEVRGDATLTPDTEQAFATTVGHKYDADLSAYDPPGTSRIVVDIEPTRINYIDMAAS